MKGLNFLLKLAGKPLELLQDKDGDLSHSRLFSAVLLGQYLFETRLVLKADPTQFVTFSITFVCLILILVAKMGAENVANIIKAIKGKDEQN